MTKTRFPQIIHTWMYGGDMEFAEVAKNVAATGADGVDLNFTVYGPKNTPDALRKLDLKAILERENLKPHCVMALYNQPDLDLVNPDPAVRKKAFDFTLVSVELAEMVGCPRIMMTPTWFSVKHAIHTTWEEDFKRAVDGVREVAQVAAKKNITVMVEPINRFRVGLLNTIDNVARLIDEVGLPNVGMCPDTYHLNMEEEQSVASAILRTKGKIRMLHIGENNRKPPGYGSMDWKSIIAALRAIDFDGPLSHEPVFRGYSEQKMNADPEFRKYFQKLMTHGVKQLNMVMDSFDS